MVRFWSRSLLAAALSAGLPSVALAQAPGGDSASLFKKLDADGDGKLKKEELPEEQRRLFERLVASHDADKDGVLTEAEFRAGLNEGRPQGEGPGPGGPGRPGGQGGDFNPEAIFRQMDRNGDGKVLPDEVPEERRDRFRQMLERVDDDKDGAATLDEFRRGFGGPGQGRPGQPGQPGQPGRPGEPGRPEGIPGGGLMAAIDTDRNGELSGDEISAAVEALKKLDRDGDGKVTQNELFPPRPEGGQPGFRPDGERFLQYAKQQDKDGDGKLSKEEAPERMRENFDRIDRNSDGFIDDTELRQMAEMMARGMAGRPEGRPPEGNRPPEGRRPEGDRKPEGERKPDGDGKPQGEGRPRPDGERKPEGERRPEGAGPDGQRRPFNEEEAKARFKAADANGDGVLSKEEMPERLREHFAQIDANGDGSVGPVEMHDAMRRMMERRGEGRLEGDSPRRRPEGRPEEKKPADQPKDEKPAEAAKTESQKSDSGAKIEAPKKD